MNKPKVDNHKFGGQNPESNSQSRATHCAIASRKLPGHTFGEVVTRGRSHRRDRCQLPNLPKRQGHIATYQSRDRDEQHVLTWKAEAPFRKNGANCPGVSSNGPKSKWFG